MLATTLTPSSCHPSCPLRSACSYQRPCWAIDQPSRAKREYCKLGAWFNAPTAAPGLGMPTNPDLEPERPSIVYTADIQPACRCGATFNIERQGPNIAASTRIFVCTTCRWSVSDGTSFSMLLVENTVSYSCGLTMLRLESSRYGNRLLAANYMSWILRAS